MGDAERRARRDVGALVVHLQRCQNQDLVHGTPEQQRATAERLVTWGWTKIGPGEQVTRKPTQRNDEISLRDELAATLTGGLMALGNRPLELAEHLLEDGWVKLAAGEKIVTPMSRAEAFETVRLALEHWETLKKTAKEKRAESAEVSADASELTSGVKGPDPESLILAAFAGADHPLEFQDVVDAVTAGKRDAFGGVLRAELGRWCLVFESLLKRKLIEALPAVEGEVKRYQLTQAGRGLHELDGVEL